MPAGRLTRNSQRWAPANCRAHEQMLQLILNEPALVEVMTYQQAKRQLIFEASPQRLTSELARRVGPQSLTPESDFGRV